VVAERSQGGRQPIDEDPVAALGELGLVEPEVAQVALPEQPLVHQASHALAADRRDLVDHLTVVDQHEPPRLGVEVRRRTRRGVDQRVLVGEAHRSVGERAVRGDPCVDGGVQVHGAAASVGTVAGVVSVAAAVHRRRRAGTGGSMTRGAALRVATTDVALAAACAAATLGVTAAVGRLPAALRPYHHVAYLAASLATGTSLAVGAGDRRLVGAAAGCLGALPWMRPGTSVHASFGAGAIAALVAARRRA
jgi:hypothetical protein